MSKLQQLPCTRRIGDADACFFAGMSWDDGNKMTSAEED